MLRVASTYPTTLRIDGEDICFRIKKLSPDEDLEFQSQFAFYSKHHARTERELLEVAKREGLVDEQGKPTIAGYQLEAIAEKNLTDQEREDKRLRELEHDRKGDAFTLDAIRRYVTADDGQILDEDSDTHVTSGEDLVRVFSSRPDILSMLSAEIHLQNHLSVDQKKALSRLRAFARSSDASEMAAGPTPETTAPSASTVDTAIAEAAMVEPEPIPSGSMDHLTPALSSTSVPS